MCSEMSKKQVEDFNGKAKASIARMSSALLLCHRKNPDAPSAVTLLRFRRGKQQTRAFPTGHFDCSGEIDEEWHSAFRSISLSASSNPLTSKTADIDENSRALILTTTFVTTFSLWKSKSFDSKTLVSMKALPWTNYLSSTMIWISWAKHRRSPLDGCRTTTFSTSWTRERERDPRNRLWCYIRLANSPRWRTIDQCYPINRCGLLYLAETSLVNKVPLCHGGGSAIGSRPWWTVKMFTSSSWTRENVVVRFRLSSMEGARITESLSDYVNKQSFPENSVVFLLCDHQSEPSTKPRSSFTYWRWFLRQREDWN